MWLFTHPPVGQVREAHGFEITPAWLDHLRQSAVRFGRGGSGSFVSAKGLVLTNHHVGAGVIERLSTPERDLLRNGYHAARLEDELRCPDLELSVLMGIEDVTGRVNAAVSPSFSAEQAAAARRAVIAAIEREAGQAGGRRGQVVTLYQGGLYHLYLYRRYDDVRLVFAPDARAAAFGGDPDNFDYPRYCLDYAFFRAYENGEPADTPHFLRWNAGGAREGELVFVAGHPGRTNRSITLAQWEDMRDHSLPEQLAQSLRTEALLRAWADRDAENARRVKNSIIGTQNGRKAHMARLNGLLDPRLMERKASGETAFRERLRGLQNPHPADDAFEVIARAVAEARSFATRLQALEGGFRSQIFGYARTLVRVVEEDAKPDGERLPEYQQANRASLELGLFSPRPLYPDVETLLLADALLQLCKQLGATDPTLRQILAGKSPQDRAAELIAASALGEVETRRALYREGRPAMDRSTDPLILLARLVDAEARALRLRSDALAETIAQAHQRIAAARFAMEGDSHYPDATFSLRLSYGVVQGYEENQRPIPFQTTLRGMAERHEKQAGRPPFDLSPQWLERAGKLDPELPVNFVSTHDITGGNSGSPVVNRAGELVGLVFDTNSHGLVSDFIFEGERGRALSVHPAVILETLKTVYDARRIVEEISRSR